MRLSKSHRHVLEAMASQHTLKSHRDIEGHKVYKLHALDGTEEIVAPSVVQHLAEHGLIDSNKKFPAATYWLTEQGKALVKVPPTPPWR